MLSLASGIGKPGPQHHDDEQAGPLEVMFADTSLLATAQPPVKDREVLGFFAEQAGHYPDSSESLEANHQLLSGLAPFWYRLDERRPGYFVSTVPTERRKAVIASARAKHLPVYMTIHNLHFPSQQKGRMVARRILRSPKTTQLFIRNLIKEIESFGYDGVNLDLENLYPADRFVFSMFVKQLGERLHEQGKLLIVNVPANTGGPDRHPWSASFDYKALGRYADRLILMCYDQHHADTSPGPVASYDWVKAAIEYALQRQVPPEKLLLGVATYGWQWSSDGRSPIFSTYAALHQRRERYGAVELWDEQARSPYFQYLDEQGTVHHVWYENEASLTHKLHLANEYDLQGIALWRLGLEPPSLWESLRRSIQVRKKAAPPEAS